MRKRKHRRYFLPDDHDGFLNIGECKFCRRSVDDRLDSGAALCRGVLKTGIELAHPTCVKLHSTRKDLWQ